MPKRKNRSDVNNSELDLHDLDFAEIDANLEAMDDHLFKAGVAILQSAKTQEELFSTSIEAIQEALEPNNDVIQNQSQLISPCISEPSSQEITLPAIWERLNHIEARLEYLINHLIPETEQPSVALVQEKQSSFRSIPQAQEHETQKQWTEKTLKKQYKTLAAVRAGLGIAARTWKLAVIEANA